MKKAAFVVISALLIMAVWGCEDSAEIQMVKGGTLSLCPNTTVENMVNSFMASPEWESGKTVNGRDFVNVKGGITYSDKPVTAVVQFLIDKENNTFKYYAFEINGLPQGDLVTIELFSKMCESAN